MGQFLGWVEEREGRRFDGYHDLWRWSVDDLAGFWSSVWEYFDVAPVTPPTAVLPDRSMPGTRWFPDATLNYAFHCLRHEGPAPAVVSYSQTREPVVWSWDELRDQVARAGLVRLGVGRGDVVAGYLPNIAEAIVAFHEIPAVPRTLSGKKLEVPVKRILTGTPIDVAAATGTLANPEALEAIAALAPTLREAPCL